MSRKPVHILSNILPVILTLWFMSTLADAQDEPAFKWPDDYRAAISLSFDDARLSHPRVAKDLFRRLNARATFYVIPNGVREELAGWKQMVADGHEIGNHTIHHPCTGNFTWSRDKALEDYTMYTMEQELIAANLEIQELLGITPKSFAYTCGNTFVGRGKQSKSYVPLIANMFESGRGWLNEASNDPLFADLSRLQGMEMDGKDFEHDIKPLVDAAIQQGRWLLLAGHEIGEDGRQTTRVQMLEELIAYVQQPENKIWLAPVGDVAAHIKNERARLAAPLQESLTFATTFDHGMDADYSLGDRRIFGAATYDKAELAVADMQIEEIQIVRNRGRFGHALEFKRKGKPVLFYQARDNIIYNQKGMSGTVSLWLSLDPEVDLEPGYTDPIQITDSGYDDAAIWVDFSDKNPRSFRMGIFGDVKIWNPNKIGPDENPAFQNRLVSAKNPSFQRGRWTHVVMTYTGINQPDAIATLYINGKENGSRKIPEPFTWNLEKAKIFLGLNYVGLLDEVAIFNRALQESEVEILYQLPTGLHALLNPSNSE